MKKILSIILALTMVITAFSASTIGASADTTAPAPFVTVDHVDYMLEKSNGQYFYSAMTFFDSIDYALVATEINIASEIDGVPVTSIRKLVTDGETIPSVPDVKKSNSTNFFERYYQNISIKGHGITGLGQNVTKINIPDSIKEIGWFAFKGFSKLKALDIPDGVESIGYGAFEGCKSLKSITLPSKVTYIPTNAFKDCQSLSAVDIKGDVKIISSNAFLNCKSLKSINLPENLKWIGSRAFQNTGLTSITIPATVTRVGYGEDSYAAAFKNCRNLTKVVFKTSSDANRVLEIGLGAFKGCTKLEEVYFPKKGKKLSIDPIAFLGCTSLNKIANYSYFDSVKIFTSAFENCTSLKKFILTDNIATLDSKAFNGCNNLSKIYVKTASKSVSNVFSKDTFKGTKTGLCFITYDTTTAKRMKTAINSTGVKNAKIYVKSKLVYKNVK